MSGQVMYEQLKLGQVMSGQLKLGQVMYGQLKLGYFKSIELSCVIRLL